MEKRPNIMDSPACSPVQVNLSPRLDIIFENLERRGKVDTRVCLVILHMGKNTNTNTSGRRDKLDLRYSLSQSLCSLLIIYVCQYNTKICTAYWAGLVPKAQHSSLLDIRV